MIFAESLYDHYIEKKETCTFKCLLWYHKKVMLNLPWAQYSPVTESGLKQWKKNSICY